MPATHAAEYAPHRHEALLVAGFYDQGVLTRHFKHCCGVPPLQFARAVRS